MSSLNYNHEPSSMVIVPWQGPFRFVALKGQTLIHVALTDHLIVPAGAHGPSVIPCLCGLGCTKWAWISTMEEEGKVCSTCLDIMNEQAGMAEGEKEG
jgi:hypothetical protein